jgi:hypothetical protein
MIGYFDCPEEDHSNHLECLPLCMLSTLDYVLHVAVYWLYRSSRVAAFAAGGFGFKTTWLHVPDQSLRNPASAI